MQIYSRNRPPRGWRHSQIVIWWICSILFSFYKGVCACVCVCTCVSAFKSPKRASDIRSPGARIIGICELPNVSIKLRVLFKSSKHSQLLSHLFTPNSSCSSQSAKNNKIIILDPQGIIAAVPLRRSSMLSCLELSLRGSCQLAWVWKGSPGEMSLRHHHLMPSRCIHARAKWHTQESEKRPGSLQAQHCASRADIIKRHV